MPPEIRDTSLLRFLGKSHPAYFGKAIELRETVTDWLSYIPHTFPHYTRHTVLHSDEIITSLSQLLFVDNDITRPILRDLSGIEAYCLVAAAYLHDAGMTVSDEEKAAILQSHDWMTWVREGGGAQRFREIQTFLGGSIPADEVLRHFLANVQMRFLIAEFVRRTHHVRGAQILAEHQNRFGRFAFDDPILERTIANVCLAHGLQQHELSDRERFPERRDIRGEKVNVRLLAILLRVGDLLDMSQDRACPLLLSAASPLPIDSLAHWTQYQCITHKMIAHDRIELRAECRNQDEHRFLFDWCDWLVKELQQAATIVPRSPRHSDWVVPHASLDEPDKSIEIRPTKSAAYIPSRWRFELDAKAIFDRLIYDTLDRPIDFLREFIQNAADATRCKLYFDLSAEGSSVPTYPTQVDEVRRAAYPIRVSLRTVDVLNELSQAREQRQVLTIEDMGIGMDREIIEKYLLQVGRSYYTTREFREKFGFVASSRFGVGFLSVFGASDDVVVDTFKPSSLNREEPLRVRITGPRSYLLTEKGQRRVTGTTISAILRTPLAPGHVTRSVKEWCGRLEFPVIVDDLGVITEIHAEQFVPVVAEVQDLSHENAEFVVRAFPVNKDGIEGHLFLLAHRLPGGEKWTSGSWARYTYADAYPQATVPEVPPNALFLHGISTGEHFSYGGFSARVDLRGERFNPSLARSADRFLAGPQGMLPDLVSEWNELLRRHLAQTPFAAGPDAWIYKQELMSNDVGSDGFWAAVPETVCVVNDGKKELVSLNDVLSVEMLHIAVRKKRSDSHDIAEAWPSVAGTVMLATWVDELSERHRVSIFQKRDLKAVYWLDEYLICAWESQDVNQWERNDYPKREIFCAPFAGDALGGPLHRIGSDTHVAVLLNSSHPFGQWYGDTKRACHANCNGLSMKHLKMLNEHLETTLRYEGHKAEILHRFILQWTRIPNLADTLIPPAVDLTKERFGLGNVRPNMH